MIGFLELVFLFNGFVTFLLENTGVRYALFILHMKLSDVTIIEVIEFY